MWRPSSAEQIGAIDRESRKHQQEAHTMYTDQSIQAEVNYRRQRLASDYRRAARTTATRGRRNHLIQLFARHAG